MRPETRLLTKVQDLLEERLAIPVQIQPTPSGGVDRGYDATLRLVVEGKPRELLVQTRTSGSVASLADVVQPGADEGARGRLLVAPRLSAPARAELRNRELNYADLAGNVFIREPGLYVLLEADRKPPRQQPSARRWLNPFSKRASLILRALLEAPGRTWGVRELAGETALSIGHASEVAQSLIRREYARSEAGGISLGNGVAALREWTGVYDWRQNEVTSYVVPFEHHEVGPALHRAMASAGVPFALTLLAGADLVAPHVQHGQTHLYVPPGQAQQAHVVVREALYGEQVSTGGTLHVLNPYYRDGVFYGSKLVDTVRVVSPVQLFMDLANYPLRGGEAARMVAMGPLAAQLGLDRRQVQELTRILD